MTLRLPRYLRVHRYDQSRDIYWVYGPRDVVAWPLSATLFHALGQRHLIEVRR